MAVGFVSKNLDLTARPSGNVDQKAMDKHIRGHVQKARVNSHDVLADALEAVHRTLKTQAEQNNDLDSEIKTSRFPTHLQLLVALSNAPDETTLKRAQDYLDGLSNPKESAPGLTWETILAEEPFEGDHWEGVYPRGTDDHLDTHSGGSTPSLSPWDDSDLDESLSSSEVLDPTEDGQLDQEAGAEKLRFPPAAYRHRQDVEDLQARQYWRPGWRTDAPIARAFNVGDASTLGPTMYRVLGSQNTNEIAGPSTQRYIHEHDAVREVLMALQGDRNMILEWSTSGKHAFSFIPTEKLQLLHLTAGAQASILTSFAQLATTLQHLRKFVSAIYSKAGKDDRASDRPMHLLNIYRQSTLTLEAFSAAVDGQLRAFNTWCAAKEEDISRAQAGVGEPLVVSFLSLDKAVRDTFSDAFAVILDVLREVTRRAWRTADTVVDIWTLPELPMKMSPSTFGALLLDSLLVTVQEHVSMGDYVSADALMQVFSESAEPMWSMVGRWMKDGMPVREITSHQNSRLSDLDEEFFVEDNELPLLDPDFWTDGFVLREEGGEGEGARRTAVPVFLSSVAKGVLDAGKAVGLLRVLDIAVLLDRNAPGSWMAKWPTFSASLGEARHARNGEDTSPLASRLLFTSTEELSQALHDAVWPHSSLAQETLQRVLVEECDLMLHLSAIENVCLMRRGDAMSHFIDILFTKMDSRQAWNDFHFLNTAFHDVAEAGTHRWIETSLVRFSHRGSKDKSVTRTVRAFEGFSLEYAVPFPLTYVFGPKAMQTYSSIFTFVLQIRRAKSVLERILVRGGIGSTSRLASEMKVFYAMRSKLSWFVNTLLNFVATNVLHAEVLSFHKDFRQTKSLNDMIRLHDEHLAKVESRCLLQRDTAALQRAIISILDMSIHFSDCFVAFAGDTTHDISRHSLIITKRHRSRRARRQRRNVIGFSQISQEGADDSSESDSDLDNDPLAANAPEPSFSMGASTMSAPDESFVDRLDKMSSELDALVRFIRRGVESLAAGSGEAAPTFGVFAFALEDWDR
ncbi:Spc98 family-domain-containing protein [Fomitopsis serialis]|uniref:Spc98 family-domain-containing protein n=1 Tax=Fomitopsis serialis TaxID=139415 RepID=UPI002008E7F4|nr:Spc98 family-domain-containing protein [Neoantrodia serialis]KAH9938094.1 Spc98 family-domain-containing protein [Neoantrodia serialis]